jgi:hypothetical protein
VLSRYPGGKNGAGVFQTLINLIPPHDLYIEAFVGSGAVYRNKRCAPASIVIDADREVAGEWIKLARRRRDLTVIHGDARSAIASLNERRRFTARTFIYCDPPYVRGSRRSPASLYRHEFSDEDHRRLLSLLLTLKACIAVSGYRHAMYDGLLADWRRVDFQAMTRHGLATESVWMNYEPPAELADYSYLGKNFRERERIKRKTRRWRSRLLRMPALERRALLASLLDLTPSDAAMGDRLSPIPAIGVPIVRKSECRPSSARARTADIADNSERIPA